MSKYFTDILWRAFYGLPTSYSLSWETVGIIAVSAVLTWSINRVRHGGWRALMRRPTLREIVSTGLAVTLFVLLVVFVIDIGKAAHQRDQEKQQEITNQKAEVSKRDATITSLQQTIKEMEKQDIGHSEGSGFEVLLRRHGA